ncbi:MAG TPA: LysE family translocator [Pseudolabrys sp.]|nr:LysE family translocator [Pseudolabrys sp.]
MNWHLFSAFFVIAIVLYLTPGPIVTLVVTTGARDGMRAALMTVAGGAVGNALLLTCIAFGLNWILQTSAEIFDYLRWIGAAYLVWLGVSAWRQAGTMDKAPAPSGHVHAWRGLVVAFTNPKTIAFFTAFLPQFIDPALPSGWQLLVMCAMSVVLGAVLDSGWAVAAGFGRAWFLKPSRTRLLNRLSGAVLVGGGLWLSLARRTG